LVRFSVSLGTEGMPGKASTPGYSGIAGKKTVFSLWLRIIASDRTKKGGLDEMQDSCYKDSSS